MSLYRKYRPSTFAEVVGQDAVVHTLEAAVAAKKPSHAYLFSGGRGIGKTSLARILARALGVTEKDLYEIDAASYNGVDDIRALREGATTLPMESPYKVYVLDEVHMLSKGAFNALLKILEEPPRHVIFMLATTDIHKVPDTILSRCEVHTLARPSRETLAEVVLKVCKSEKVKIEKEAADVIALLGDGSFRDTLSVLQQVMTGAEGGAITDTLVQEKTGAPTHALVRELLTAWGSGDTHTALALIQRAHGHGSNMEILFSLLMEIVRAVLLVRAAGGTSSEQLKKQYSPDLFSYITMLATKPEGAFISSKLLRTLLETGKDIRRSDYPHVLIELAILENISPVEKVA
jgi:DNA polymerase-3 subunit gamma/tau